jgi:hypothetical protein
MTLGVPHGRKLLKSQSQQPSVLAWALLEFANMHVLYYYPHETRDHLIAYPLSFLY